MPDSDNMRGEMGLTLWTLADSAFFQGWEEWARWDGEPACKRPWTVPVCLYFQGDSLG